MSIRRKINKAISCILVFAMVLSCMAQATPVLARGQVTLVPNTVPLVRDTGENGYLYTQDFSEVTDVTTMASSLSLADSLAIADDEEHGNYFAFDVASANPGGGRGARLDISGFDVSSLDAYIVEFDAAIRVANGGASSFAVMGADFAYSGGSGSSKMNSGVGSGYLLNLYNSGANVTDYTLEGAGTVTLASEAWYSYKLYVDKTAGRVSVTITDAAGSSVADKQIVSYNGGGVFAGFYMLEGRYNGATMIDNIVVREVTENDEFGDTSTLTVTFDVNGHGDTIADAEVLTGSLVTAPTAPMADGYVFRGWYTEAECTTPWDFTAGVSGNMTLYARWIQDPAADNEDALYSQSFSGIADAGTVATSTNAQNGITIETDDEHGYYLSYAISGQSGNRGAYMDFAGLDVTSKNTYVVEFDAALTPGNGNASQFAVKGADFQYTDSAINSGAAGGYILKLANAGGNSTVYTVNDGDTTVTIPSGEWCHYKLSVDKTAGTVAVTITGTTTADIANELTAEYNGAGNAAGFYMLIGRYAGSDLFDNVLVYAVDNTATVTFNMMGHGTAISDAVVTKGETVAEPTEPEAAGWIFGGWYIDSECSQAYSFDTAVTADVTLYAKWTEAAAGTEVYLVKDATGATTAVDCSVLVYNENVIGYRITTSNNGVLVKQTDVTAAPSSVDTTGADKLEITPIFYYDIGVAGELGTGGYDIALPAGTYDFVVYNTSGNRCDVYANTQMLVNNILQNGSTPNYFAVKDIVISEDNIKIATADYSSGQSAGNVKIQVKIAKSPSTVSRVQKVYVLGDSLVAVYYNGANKDNNIRTGWGQVLADYLTSDVDVVDLANSGVTAIGLYNTAFSQIKGSAKAGDILILESGYNDKSYSSETEMKTAVTNMVNEAKALGVEVILVSPNASKHDYKESVAWTSYMADVAAAENVTYIDLSKLSYNFLLNTYSSDYDTIYNNYNLPDDGDSLHSSYNGANKWASLVAGSLYEQGYSSIVDEDYVYTFVDTVGNVISCSATGRVADGYSKVTYVMNGYGANVYRIVENGSKLTEPTKPVASGMAFVGWYKDEALSIPWKFDTDTVGQDTVIYASWVDNSQGTWYSQDFTDVSDASTVAISASTQEQLVISNDETHGNYLAFDFSSINTNSRGAYMDFGNLDVSDQNTYIIEFDAMIKPGNNQVTYFTVKGTDFSYISNNINYGSESGYIINLVNTAGGSTTYTLNGTQTADIPGGEWCHYKLYVDKTQGLVSTTVTGSTAATGTILDKAVSAYDGGGNVAGLYMLAGRYNSVIAVDNVIVRGVTEYDEFGEVVEETLYSAEFTSGLNTIITQPAEGSPVHKLLTVKGIGNLNGDLSDKVSVSWSVVGLEEEDGYISLTKEAGTGAGTDGAAPDGTTAYFNVRNGVSNYFGYVKAEVSLGEKSFTIITPFAVLGAQAASSSQLAPAAGYPASMDDYAASMVGYAGTSNGLKTQDIILNNWSIYGSNGSRSMELAEISGKKAIKFASNGGSGSTVAVYQWTDQSSQYVMDITVMFTAAMTFGVYDNTPNNASVNSEWAVSYNAGALTIGTETVSGVNANEWYRIIVSADPSINLASMTVYDNSGNLVGSVNDVAMTEATGKYFSFTGTWPMYLNSFKAYKPSLSSIAVSADAETVKVPENGAAAATVDLSAVLTSNEGVKMTGAVVWSLAEEYANVELAATGAQTATLTINEGASGAVTVVATKDGKQDTKTIQLTTSSNTVSFSQSTSSVTIPFTGEAAVVNSFVAVTLNGEGETIDGGAITYSLLAKDGVTATTVKGVTFAGGVLTVAAGASPAVVYVKATNAEGLSAKVKVNIHGLSFAFGSDEAAEGYTQVEDTLYTERLGYGFANTDSLTVNAGNVTGSVDFRFKASVPNGNYIVKVTTSADSLTSEVVETVTAVTGITKSGSTFNVAVCDGVLDLTFPAASTVTSLEISQAAAKTALEKPMIYAIGDSTTKNNASGALSWGNCVADSKVIVPSVFGGFANHGMAGRDSVNYYNQGRVEEVLLAICPGDYVTVNMGINSSATGEAASYYTLLSEYYVEGIIQRGGIPVIVTATPDGPVGDRTATNYDSATGKFTNNRGDGARNDVLRQIAAEKGINIIELGQWGEDWMNSLTAADITAYNSTYGTSYTTVLEMVQSWYGDHNHYKEYLGIQIAEYLLGQLKNLAVKKTVISFDFQNETSTNWEMTGDLSASVTIVDDAATAGNKYLQLYKSEARTTTTTRAFADMPKMSEATVAFKWYFGGQTSTSRAGFTGIMFMDGTTELLSLYIGEMRAAGDTSSLYYSTGGLDAKVDTGVKVANGSWYDISIDFDFTNDTAVIYVGAAKAATISIGAVFQKVDAMAFVTFDPNGGTKVTPTMGIDDFSIGYVEKTAEDDVITIYSLGKIDNVPVTGKQYSAGYAHPTSVSATLTNGDTITVTINSETWTCENFNRNKKGAYTWTADIIAPSKYANNKGLKATYIMEYSVVSADEHDYYNDFTFAGEMISSVAWGKSMDSNSGTGYFTFTHGTDSTGNGYLNASVSGGGDRGSRLDLDSGIIKGATFSFDWMPINTNTTSYGQIMFVSNSKAHSYLTFRFDSSYNISVFTENPLGACSTTQNAFEGSVSGSDPIVTGLGGQNKWFAVSLTFDYLAHTVDITITDKADPTNTFTRTGLPIEAEANGIRAMVMHMAKLSGTGSVTMGIDNIIADYVGFNSRDVVKITNPANVAIARTQFDAFEFPGTVVAELGNGTKIDLPVKKWTATPEFDKNVAAEYVWNAELAFGRYTNYFDLGATFTMTYTLLPYPTYVYSPTTLELEYGSAFTGEFPTTVIAHMSDGSIGTVEVGDWTAIREFNAGEEGIYVYGANIVAKDGAYDVLRDKLSPNENPDDPSAQRAAYVYDVYYRISYFENEDNYNAYTRSMEYLDRGVYAIRSGRGVFVSWRLLATEYGEDIAFNVYRNGVLVNEDPITNKTNYYDSEGRAGDTYTVAKLWDGGFFESDEVTANSKNYISIPMQKPEPQADKNGNLATYTLNDAGTADVDGDGQYEIIIKWYPSDGFDSGSAVEPSAPTIFDVYEMDGTPLWRLNLGLEMPSGAHFNPFMLYDLDEDGKAELFIKTSDGSVTYKPNAQGKFDMTDESTIVSYIGDKSVTPGQNINSNGHAADTSNEYITVFNGMTGEEIDTIDFINTTGEYTDWGTTGGGGNDGGNRSARYNIAVAYLPVTQNDAGCTETIPAVLYNRGYYDKTTVAAYTLRDGKITLEWNFVAESGTEYAGKGNHNVATGDVDKDGFDEIVIGAMAIDHDGTVLWVKNGEDGQDYAGHADSIHLAAMNPDKNDLYVFTPQEHQEATLNYSLVNAGTGTRWLASWFTKKDVGRGVAANITPLPGYESWAGASGSGLYAFDGTVISKSKNVPMNWVLYWDGDLLSELADGSGTEGNTVISKYNWETDSLDTLAKLSDTKMCNWTKNTPSLTADLLGDWREEVVVRNSDDTELRIYMTNIETDYMIYTLMHDPVYRNAVANQNTEYNQPAHVGIYLGEDQRDVVLNMQLDTANVRYAANYEEIREELNGTTADNVIERIGEIGLENLADAVQNDEDIYNRLSELENQYNAGKQIEVLDPVVTHSELTEDSILNVTGIGLNAENSGSTIQLKISNVSKDNKKYADPSVYGKYVPLDISLECDGVPVKGKLKAPISITMKLPEGLDINGIWILHYVDDGIELIKPSVRLDGTITFTVTSFSTFVFANKGGEVTIEEDDDLSADEKNRQHAQIFWNGSEGWQLFADKWYYFDASGTVKIGWLCDKDGRWYYLNNDGSMATRWICSPASGLWYYMDAVSGNMLSNGWLCDPASNLWYYLNENGAMCTGWIFVDGKWYLLDMHGAMCTGWNFVDGKWYFMDQSGAMLVGWQQINNKMYYLDESGKCLMDTITPDGHRVDETGARAD